MKYILGMFIFGSINAPSLHLIWTLKSGGYFLGE